MQDGGLIERAILHACVAGSLRMVGRTDERVQRGLNKAAGHHSARAATLIAEWLDTGKTGDGCTYAAVPAPTRALNGPNPRRI